MNTIYYTTKSSDNLEYIKNYINIKEKKDECLTDKISILSKKQKQQELKNKYIELLSNLNEINFNNYKDFIHYLSNFECLNELFCYFNTNENQQQNIKNILYETMNSVEKLKMICININIILELLCNIKELLVKINSCIYDEFQKKLVYDEIFSNMKQIQSLLYKHTWVNDCIIEDDLIKNKDYCENIMYVDLQEKKLDICILEYFLEFSIDCFEYNLDFDKYIQNLTLIMKEEENFVKIILKNIKIFDNQLKMNLDNIDNIIEEKKNIIKVKIENELCKLNNSIEYLTLCINMC